MPIRSTLVALALLAAAALAPAQTLKVAGVDYPQEARVAGQTLALNGAGVRYKFIVKVYTAGLYLTAKAGSADAVLAAPGPKRLKVVMLRDIDANELGRLFTRGMQDNSTREEFAKCIQGTLSLAELFSRRKRLKEGDSFSVDWVPGTGTLVRVNDEADGDAIKEPEFFKALMRIWLGPHPADAQLKDLLLGRAPVSPGVPQAN